MDLRKIFFATLVLPLSVFVSCATTDKKEEETVCYYDLTLTLMVDSDPYEGAARNFSLRDISGELTV
ncbi:MAG: hypothetical protein VZR56_07455, partial [Treponema sp.]|nr:hypothetical protein [Treponema sp.]